MPSMPFAFIFYNVTPHPSTDAYARERFDEKDMLLLQQYVAGRFMMLQGNVAGSDFPLDAAETDATAQAAQAAQAAQLLRLRLLVQDAPRFSPGPEPGVLWRGALVNAGIARKKRKQLDIAMPHVFSCSMRCNVAVDWATHHKEHHQQPHGLVWAVFRIEVPPETPALRVSQSSIIYNHSAFLWDQDTLIQQREVMLPPGELTNVAWQKKSRTGLLFVSCLFRAS